MRLRFGVFSFLLIPNERGDEECGKPCDEFAYDDRRQVRGGKRKGERKMVGKDERRRYGKRRV